MEKTLLEKVRKMNWVFQESSSGAFSFSDLCRILSELLDSNIYILGMRGKLISSYQIDANDNLMAFDVEDGVKRLSEPFVEELLKMNETRENLTSEDFPEAYRQYAEDSRKYQTIVPIFAAKQRWGTLVLTRAGMRLSDEDMVLAEYGAVILGLEMQKNDALENELEEREKSIVQMAISTLSYSELDAVTKIFEELHGTEGLLVASKIADRSGITRSVIVNALRKLESAGVIESRSLGMKGTYIKIINNKFKEQLEKAQF